MLKLLTSPDNVNNVVGYKRENIKKLKDFYDVEAKVKQDNKIKNGKIIINVKKVYKDFLDDNESV